MKCVVQVLYKKIWIKMQHKWIIFCKRSIFATSISLCFGSESTLPPIGRVMKKANFATIYKQWLKCWDKSTIFHRYFGYQQGLIRYFPPKVKQEFDRIFSIESRTRYILPIYWKYSWYFDIYWLFFFLLIFHQIRQFVGYSMPTHTP